MAHFLKLIRELQEIKRKRNQYAGLRWQEPTVRVLGTTIKGWKHDKYQD